MTNKTAKAGKLLETDSSAALRNDKRALCRGDAEEFGHFVVEEALAGFVRLDPFAVENKLGDGAFAGVGDDEVGCAWSGFDVDFVVGNVVSREEALGLATVAAP